MLDGGIHGFEIKGSLHCFHFCFDLFVTQITDAAGMAVLNLLRYLKVPLFNFLSHLTVSIPKGQSLQHAAIDLLYTKSKTTEGINRRVLEGLPFRDAYREVGQEKSGIAHG